jgi:hypothetical protein
VDEGLGDLGADAGEDDLGAEQAGGVGGLEDRAGDGGVDDGDAGDVEDRELAARGGEAVEQVGA